MSASSTFPLEQMALLLEENEQLRQENKELRRMLFGSKRERFVPAVDEAQLSLGLEGEPTEATIPVKQTLSATKEL
jgi:transposase